MPGPDLDTADANDQDSENNDEDIPGKTDESSSDLERPERPPIKKTGRRSTTDKLREEAAAQAEVDNKMGTYISELMKLWKCDNKTCKNYELTCYKKREDGGGKLHYKLLHNHLSQWNIAIRDKEASLTEPPLSLHLLEIGKSTPKRTSKGAVEEEMRASKEATEEELRETHKNTNQVVQGFLKMISSAPAPAAITATTPQASMIYPGYSPQFPSFSGYQAPFAPQFQQFGPQFGTAFPYQYGGGGYGSPAGISAFSGQQSQQFSSSYPPPYPPPYPSQYPPQYPPQYPSQYPPQYPPSPAPIAAAAPPQSPITLPVRLSPPKTKSSGSRRHISSSSEYSDVLPSSPLHASGGYTRILHTQDFSKLLHEYIKWQIHQAPNEEARFNSIYQKIHNEGYGLEDIQGFKSKNWARIKVPIGIGKRLRSGIKIFLDKQIARQQQLKQGATALIELRGRTEMIRHNQTYINDTEAANSVEESEYE